MSFGLYNLGTLLLIAGVVYVCHLAHLPQRWAFGVGLLLLGAGVAGAASYRRQSDPG